MIKKLSKLFRLNDTKQAEKINEIVDAVNNGGRGVITIELPESEDVQITEVIFEINFTEEQAKSIINSFGAKTYNDIIQICKYNRVFISFKNIERLAYLEEVLIHTFVSSTEDTFGFNGVLLSAFGLGDPLLDIMLAISEEYDPETDKTYTLARIMSTIVQLRLN